MFEQFEWFESFKRFKQLKQVKPFTTMKSYRKELWFNIPSRRGFVNITPQVEDCLRESGIAEGMVLVNAMHITASVLSTTMNGVCSTTSRSGSKNSRPTSR